MKTIEIEIVRSRSRQNLKMDFDKVVKKFRSKGLEVVVHYRTQAIVNGIEAERIKEGLEETKTRKRKTFNYTTYI